MYLYTYACLCVNGCVCVQRMIISGKCFFLVSNFASVLQPFGVVMLLILWYIFIIHDSSCSFTKQIKCSCPISILNRFICARIHSAFGWNRDRNMKNHQTNKNTLLSIISPHELCEIFLFSHSKRLPIVLCLHRITNALTNWTLILQQ